MRLIECRGCRSPYCDGCNIYILATMLRNGKFDCLMDEHHSVAIDPEELRPKGRWIEKHNTMYDISRDEEVHWFTYVCANPKCGWEAMNNFPYCPNCGAKMEVSK